MGVDDDWTDGDGDLDGGDFWRGVNLARLM